MSHIPVPNLTKTVKLPNLIITQTSFVSFVLIVFDCVFLIQLLFGLHLFYFYHDSVFEIMLGFISGAVVLSLLLLIKLSNSRLIQVVGDLDDNYNVGLISKNGKYVTPGHIHLSWEDAQNYCELNYGTDLASIYSNEDEIELIDLIKSIDKITIETNLNKLININLDYIWIGLHTNEKLDSGDIEWKWLNNYGYKEEIIYSNWCENEFDRRLLLDINENLYCGNIIIDEKCWMSRSCNLEIKQMFVCNYNSRPTRVKGQRQRESRDESSDDEPCDESLDEPSQPHPEPPC